MKNLNIIAAIICGGLATISVPFGIAGCLGALEVVDPNNTNDIIKFVLLCIFCLGYISMLYFLSYLHIKKRKWKLALILSLIACIALPFGTIAGAFSVFTLTRNTIKNNFQR